MRIERRSRRDRFIGHLRSRGTRIVRRPALRGAAAPNKGACDERRWGRSRAPPGLRPHVSDDSSPRSAVGGRPHRSNAYMHVAPIQRTHARCAPRRLRRAGERPRRRGGGRDSVGPRGFAVIRPRSRVVPVITVDPEANETNALFDLVQLDGAEVLEIGCGDGRLTWRYADRAARVTALEPFGDSIARANARLAEAPNERIELRNVAFE